MRPSLNRKLVLERPVRQPDGAGGHSLSWEPLGTLWAEISASNGRERRGPVGPVSRLPVRIVVRSAAVGSAARPVPGQRLVEGARNFSILSVQDHDSAGRFLRVTAQEETGV